MGHCGVFSPLFSHWQPSSVQPRHPGLCQDGSGQRVAHGGEVTLLATLCLLHCASPGILPRGWEAGMWSELAEGRPEGWPVLCLAAHKCPGGMGCGEEFPLGQQQPPLRGLPHCGFRGACKPVTKGASLGALLGTRC